ncbi:MAG: succinylglutamate desuccinylase/aspartoacylase family protein [Candidatus Pacearchaeota archaeon]
MKKAFIRLFRGADSSMRRLPLLYEQARKPGPVIWITSAIHGNEVTGIEVIHRLFNSFKTKKLKRGTVYALPITNPLGFEMKWRENPYDENDLNRAFPGDLNGSTTERIAAMIFKTITETKPSLVIDLHSDTLNSIPYIIIDRALGIGLKARRIVEKSWRLAERFGVTVVYDIEVPGYTKYLLDKSLTAALVNRAKIPAFSVELGGPTVIHESFVRIGVKGIKNMLAAFDMLEIEEEWCSETKIRTEHRLELLEELSSNKSGIVKFLVKPGDFVKEGTPLVEITNVLGDVEEVLYSKCSGYIIALADTSIAFPGSPLVTMAIEKK